MVCCSYSGRLAAFQYSDNQVILLRRAGTFLISAAASSPHHASLPAVSGASPGLPQLIDLPTAYSPVRYGYCRIHRLAMGS